MLASAAYLQLAARVAAVAGNDATVVALVYAILDIAIAAGRVRAVVETGVGVVRVSVIAIFAGSRGPVATHDQATEPGEPIEKVAAAGVRVVEHAGLQAGKVGGTRAHRAEVCRRTTLVKTGLALAASAGDLTLGVSGYAAAVIFSAALFRT